LVGSTPAAQNFIETVKKYYYYGYKCTGFVDEAPSDIKDCEYLGNINQLGQILLKNPINEVVIALPNDKCAYIAQCI
jgi:putative colanic acid biosynthesis UDP-glucose lipid carrier transferase